MEVRIGEGNFHSSPMGMETGTDTKEMNVEFSLKTKIQKSH